LLAALQYAARDAVGQQHRIEVDQQTDGTQAKLEVCQKLCLMDRERAFDRFDLQDHLLVHDDVGDLAAIKASTVIIQWERHLATIRYAGSVKFVAEASLINHLKQARTHAAMDTHCEADDPVREFTVVYEAGLHGSRVCPEQVEEALTRVATAV
jgi:hypothetical protein